MSTGYRPALGLFILRIAVGITFFVHGYQKLIQMGMPAVSGGFAHMSVPLPGVTGPLVTLLEFFGGIALIIGLLTRLTALGFVIEMLGAIFLVHIKNGFAAPMGFQLPFVLCGASAALMLAGAGEWALDDVIIRRRAVVGGS